MKHLSNVSVFDTPEQVAVAAAERFVESLSEFRDTPDRFSVALAGGITPRRVYELLAGPPLQDQINWPRVHLFFGDERCVPPDHPDSNYAMVYATLISKIQIPANNVHRLRGEGNPHESAALYEDDLRTFFAGLTWPRFDLVLLGMGEDGHTASLFPNSEALWERSRWVVATKNPQSDQDRITLTLPVLNHGGRVMFLVTGAKKARRLRDVLLPRERAERVPAQTVAPIMGKLEWLVDAEAASLL